MSKNIKNNRELIELDTLIFSSPIRLLVMVLLLKNKTVAIKDLIELTKTSPGNFDHHIKQLEEANYVEKLPIRRNERLVYAVRLTSSGKGIILNQLGNLKKIISDYEL